MVCLSGFITHSLDEVLGVTRELQRAVQKLPMIVGGATTSEFHLALKIAPENDGIVVWSKDAACKTVLATRMMNPDERKKLKAELDVRYEKLLTKYHKRKE